MGAAETIKKYTEKEYLELERKASERSEFYDGDIFAMSGASHKHNIIAGNFFAWLHANLRGKNCRPYGSDMRLHIPGKKLYTYPDITVVCGDPKLLDNNFDNLLNPVFICEVLSPSTAVYDTGNKFTFYRSIPTLKEYWAISSFEYRLQKFIHNEKENSWLLTETVNKDELAPLTALGLEVPLSDVYEGVTF